MPKRSPERWLAPAALVAAAIAVYVVVKPAVGEDAAERGTPAAETTTPRTTTSQDGDRGSRTTRTGRRRTRAYRVQPGDTLSSIAMDHSMTLEELQELNPGVDSASLKVGEELRVRDAGSE